MRPDSYLKIGPDTSSSHCRHLFSYPLGKTNGSFFRYDILVKSEGICIHANAVAVLLCEESVECPDLCALISKSEILDALRKGLLAKWVVNTASADRSGEVSGEVDGEILKR